MATHPPSWRYFATLGDVYVAKGDRAKATELFDKAMSMTHEQAERVEVQDSINAMGADAK